MPRLFILCLLTIYALTLPSAVTHAATADYDIGSPTLQDVWVSTTGSDVSGDGTSRATAFASLRRAWIHLPSSAVNGTGYRIRLTPGSYRGAYLESWAGSAQFPILIEPADGPGTVTFTAPYGEQGALQFLNVSYLYLQDLVIDLPYSGDGFQCERCDHVLLRRMRVRTVRGSGQTETVKLNQSRHIYIEDSEFSGAGDNALDAVGVQYGHLLRSKMSDAQDWCAYLKGGSAYFRVEGNEFFNCGTGGFTSGQGSGFQFMTSPWLHYEAYGITFVNNVIHDVEGACMGVNGGYNIMYAYNTCVRVGERSHVLEVVFGGRTCDGGDAVNCQPRLTAGGWANPDFSSDLQIPNRRVFILNNVIYNPAGHPQSQWQQFDVRGPVAAVPGSNVPTGATGDDGLVIAGNVIWNSPQNGPSLGTGETQCGSSNPTCNPTQLEADNAINAYEPQLQSASFVPLTAGNLLSVTAVPIPTLSWSDVPTRPAVPTGDSVVTVLIDRAGRPRCGGVGAYVAPDAAPCVLPPTATPNPGGTPTATATAIATLLPTVTPTPTVPPASRVWLPLTLRAYP
jgi:hypothetical protein